MPSSSNRLIITFKYDCELKMLLLWVHCGNSDFTWMPIRIINRLCVELRSVGLDDSLCSLFACSSACGFPVNTHKLTVSPDDQLIRVLLNSHG